MIGRFVQVCMQVKIGVEYLHIEFRRLSSWDEKPAPYKPGTPNSIPIPGRDLSAHM